MRIVSSDQLARFQIEMYTDVTNSRNPFNSMFFLQVSTHTSII